MRQGLVSIVVPVKDNLAVTCRCIEAVFAHTPQPFELIVIDNGSAPDVADALDALARAHTNGPEMKVQRNAKNEGFGYASNQGIAAARGEWIVLLNNDVVVTEGWLARMLRPAAQDPRIGMVGPRTNRASGPQQVDAVGYQDLDGLAAFAAAFARENAGRTQELCRLVGLCLLVRRAVIEDVGGFDTCFWLGNFEDDDLCLRAVRKGWKLVVAQDAFVHHHGGATFTDARLDYGQLMRDNWRWFRHKWEFEQPLGAYPARQLATARPFDAERDAVPVRYDEIFWPGAAPLPLAGVRETRLLLFADGVDEGWKEPFTKFVRAFRPDDAVTLVLRLDPPTDDVIEHVTAEVGRLVAPIEGIPEESLPDVLIEPSPVPARRRGGLYTACSALIASTSARAPLYEREARSCGLPVLAEPTLAALRPTLSAAAR